jgi:Asp-tRNA(Asn)/Glu-tRNA(Gln) amidotransferase A subunit family amidase
MYLERLKRLDPSLLAVVTLTEERALREAERADQEIAAGRYRGPLHGIPWGAKDLLAAKGYRTTWGSVPFKDQVIDQDATAVERLVDAGAVLVAKLSLGELARGDVWFGGMTRNPWNLEQGSSGSSAGPAAATVAGGVGFALGSETLGSIVSPSTRTGATGLRPTFGRVSRHGAMTLCWSLDKIGPICRSVEDCALVLAAIQGPDCKDATVVDMPYSWDPRRDVRKLRIGYAKSLFEEKPAEGQEEWHALDLAALEALRQLGIELRPIELPRELPISALRVILGAESAAAFDELTRGGKDDQLVRQVEGAWPNSFRQGQTIPAVAYIQANRVRTLLMREMDRLFADLDVYLAPTYGGDNLLLTNLTGHPQVTLPNGFRKDGTPTSLTFTGRLFGEAELLAVAKAYQDATGFHLRVPELKA